MKTVMISDSAHDRLEFAAKVAGVSVTDAVDRLVGISADSAIPSLSSTASQTRGSDEIAVSATYRGQRISGFLDLDSERLRITDSPTSELVRTYRSPSQAAVETVRKLNPGRQNPETNGWRFWRGPGGQIIDRYRRKQP